VRPRRRVMLVLVLMLDVVKYTTKVANFIDNMKNV
jgi:hypothetical protein